jgi:hypothetical protein
MAPLSLRSESCGFLLPPRFSTSLESWESARTGTLNSLAIDLRALDISDTSCCLFSIFLATFISWR